MGTAPKTAAEVNLFPHGFIYSSVSVMIIVHVRSLRLFTHSRNLTCLHYDLKGNMTRGPGVSAAAANQKGH